MSQLYSNCDGDDNFTIQATDDELASEYFPDDDSNDSNYSGTGSETSSDGSPSELEQDIDEEELSRKSYSLVGTDDKLNGMLPTPMS